MTEKQLVPHFVADRPMSLRILEGLNFTQHPVRVGLMIQACTSQNFRNMVSQFPCGDQNYCGVVNGVCPYSGNLKKCSKGQLLKKCITTIADSGVFTKGGSPLDYPTLFQRYQKMKVKRGIILDVLGDMKNTIKSAKYGQDIYNEGDYSFKLIGVAQGKNVKEYEKCYEKLRKMEYEEIAIGGLLTKHDNTARYASSNKIRIESIVKEIHKEWPDDRCFTLGVYNPKRHDFLENLGVNAADYKGWIFQYRTDTYTTPLQHHFDRISQTRYFIEKNVLSPMSGKNCRKRQVRFIANNTKNKLIIQSTRVVVGR